MTTLNLFLKSCPECATTLPIDAKHCSCGYSYEPRNKTEAHPSQELVAKAEALYEYFLTARAVQALNAVKKAKIELAEDPDDLELAIRVKRAEQEAQAIQAKLAAQTFKTAEARKIAKKAKERLEQLSRRPFGEGRESTRLFEAFSDRANETVQNVQSKAIAEALGKTQQEPSSAEQLAKAEEILRNINGAHPPQAGSDLAAFITDEEFAELRDQGTKVNNL